ncbi:MAG: FAD-dependent oxidoreductase [Chloroflexota bacterium]|nr:FAD-dependent oxidoreductase [Chloroflexota bacterium]
MKQTNILIIGGGPAGLVAASTARTYYPEKEITLVRKTDRTPVPCGIPYIFNRLEGVDQNLIPDGSLDAQGIKWSVREVIKIETEAHQVIFADGEKLGYEKLVLATGSTAVRPPIPGAEKEGVFVVKKSPSYLRRLRAAVLAAKNIVIIGGGFIGVEFAEEISQMENKSVSIVEMLPRCLCTAFDDEICEVGEAELKRLGVTFYMEEKVTQIAGEGKLEVVLASGKRLPADLVLISVGARPNVELAAEAGVEIGFSKAIWVDEYMRTPTADVFAIGDCAEKKDFFTRKTTQVMLASTACTEARIAGANLYKLNVVREKQGSLANFSTHLGDVTLASAGLTERRAREENFDIVVGVGKTKNRHPGSLPGAHSVMVKLVFSADSLVLLGGQVSGGQEAGELINTIALALQNLMTANQLTALQVATHPLLTSAPTTYPLVTAAMQAIAKR